MKLRAKFASTPHAPDRVEAPGIPAKGVSASPAARNLALAHRLAQLIDQGLIADYTAAARLLGVSQPRLTHVASLVLLAPQIQEAILLGSIAPGDKHLRRLARIAEWQEQLAVLPRG